MRIGFISGFGSVEVLGKEPRGKLKVRDLATGQIMHVSERLVDIIKHTHVEINPGN